MQYSWTELMNSICQTRQGGVSAILWGWYICIKYLLRVILCASLFALLQGNIRRQEQLHPSLVTPSIHWYLTLISVHHFLRQYLYDCNDRKYRCFSTLSLEPTPMRISSWSERLKIKMFSLFASVNYYSHVYQRMKNWSINGCLVRTMSLMTLV